MKRYYFTLMDEDYNDLSALIPDGINKLTAVLRAKKWMRENGIKTAILQVNSLKTDDIIEHITIASI
ncbi:MAG: hypothetical protein HDS49_02005 [Bacteroides sp.]|nr:hypothetical protein [Bacteroides sp.]